MDSVSTPVHTGFQTMREGGPPEMCDRRDQPSLSATLENLRRPMPLSRKLYLTLRNNWIKIRTRSNCCGNHGEPGC